MAKVLRAVPHGNPSKMKNGFRLTFVFHLGCAPPSTRAANQITLDRLEKRCRQVEVCQRRCGLAGMPGEAIVVCERYGACDLRRPGALLTYPPLCNRRRAFTAVYSSAIRALG